jgi:hypothetical protein
MRKSAVAIPIIALIAGAFGFFIRQTELNTAFESVTGLAKRNAQPTLILIGLSVAVIVLAAVFAIIAGSKYKAENDYSKVFAPKGYLYIGVSFLLGLGWIVADALYLLNKSGTALSFIDIVFIFLSAVAALAVIVLARGAYKGRGGNEMLLFSIVPSIFFCYWLIILYKNNAANPILLSYCFQCIAIAAAALSYYFSAGFVYNKSVTGRALFSFLVTIFFCAVVLADNVILPIKMIFAVTMILQFVNTVIFIRNLKRKSEI